MKTARFFAMAFLGAASICLVAQQVSDSTQVTGQANASANASPGGVEASGSGKAVYTTQGPMDFGDEAASHAYEMSSVTGELQGKLDAKHAKVGDRVVLKTTGKVQTSDGTVLPRGTRLVGHITQVQTRDSAHAFSQLGIAFDRAELKNGQSLAIHTLIRGVSPSPGVMAINSMNSGDSLSAMGEPAVGGGMAGGGRGGRSGGGQPDLLGGALQKTAQTTTSVSDRVGAAGDVNAPGAVELAGRGDLNDRVGAHQAAAARAIPHATAIPGVMLAGDSSASGLFSASKKDIQFDSGTQMQLGIVKDSGR